MIAAVNHLVWGLPMLVLLLGTGGYLTVRTGFPQLRFFPQAVKNLLPGDGRPRKKGETSPFRALCTALAATVGTGNLIGVAGAISLGGPGAVFWMWISGFLGMGTKYAEAVLAVRYREEKNGQIAAGPMFMIEKGIPRWRRLGELYCFLGIIAAFGVGNATQTGAVIGSINEVLASAGKPASPGRDLILGALLGLLLGFVLLGGGKRIGAAAALLVPAAAAVYFLLGAGVLILRREALPAAFSAIFRGAFSPGAVTGGAVGSVLRTLRTGVARGVFSNEAGMGTAAMAHGRASVDHPARQGLLGMMEVFVDTHLICTLTALVILVSGVPIPYGMDAGGFLTSRAFSAVLGQWAGGVLAAAVSLFAFATILGWGLYGLTCARYLLGERGEKGFLLLQCFMAAVSAGIPSGTVWMAAETVNGLMAVPNVFALLALTPELVRLTAEYAGKPPRFQLAQKHTGSVPDSREMCIKIR